MDDERKEKPWFHDGGMDGRDIQGQVPQGLFEVLVIHSQRFIIHECREVLFGSRTWTNHSEECGWEERHAEQPQPPFLYFWVGPSAWRFDSKTPCSSAKHCLQAGAKHHVDLFLSSDLTLPRRRGSPDLSSQSVHDIPACRTRHENLSSDVRRTASTTCPCVRFQGTRELGDNWRQLACWQQGKSGNQSDSQGRHRCCAKGERRRSECCLLCRISLSKAHPTYRRI
ncbi:hypothetical protein CONLIGDRAFT_123765 [Coniochaeta ligniaria NRRL 30616]|uniref:Uncharacterized protein n=1 Tax=Coniochaeta ligniaria NRRL 30616 TaxID=1408157 RepID=A0A1J7I8U2_9PEZI|nr:hypothetical protein CONLIGDRAFT_123765 [Coniochaeta ligniaria NRRL 30616]